MMVMSIPKKLARNYNKTYQIQFSTSYITLLGYTF